jgi:pimeloyl-ACP methyl ester carboxylesterase
MPETTINSTDGTKLAARYSGHGSPVVLVHGANGDLDTFALIEGLLAERHSVWVYSRRGRGGSGDGPDYSLQNEVDDVLAVLAAAGDRAHLVGHSGGAAYCLLAAKQSPSLRSLVLYEPPLRLDRFDTGVIDDAQAALDAGNPDRALELVFPLVGAVDQEVQILRSLEPVWQSLQAGVQLVPRETRLTPLERDRLMAFDPPNVPTLYLYGEETDAPTFATPDEVPELLPNAQLHGLPGQRHLAFAFDPTAFAQAILTFTTAHDD